MAKNYALTADKYQAQHGLLKVYVKDPSTGQQRLNLLTKEQAKKRGLVVV